MEADSTRCQSALTFAPASDWCRGHSKLINCGRGHTPKACSGRSPDLTASSPMSALVGASLMPLLMRSATCRCGSAGGQTDRRRSDVAKEAVLSWQRLAEHDCRLELLAAAFRMIWMSSIVAVPPETAWHMCFGTLLLRCATKKKESRHGGPLTGPAQPSRSFSPWLT